MRTYVKGLVFSLILLFFILPVYGLVIGAVIVVSAVKIIAAILSFLAVPLAGIAHFFIKGSLVRKIVFFVITLSILGILAYTLLNMNFVFEEDVSYMQKGDGLSKVESVGGVKGMDDSAFFPDISVRIDNPTGLFVYIFVVSSVILSIISFVLISAIVILLKKIREKDVLYKQVLLKVFFVSFLIGGFLGFLFSIKFLSVFDS